MERLLFRRAAVLPLPRTVLPTPPFLVCGRRLASSETGTQADESESDTYTSPYASSPRTYRGVHRRDQRAMGQTPAEQSLMDDALREIFRKMPPIDALGPFDLGPSSIFDPMSTSAARSRHGNNLEPGSRPWSAQIRRGFDREENDDMIEALDELKEEVSEIQTDLELLDWARKRVFTLTTTPTGTESHGQSQGESDQAATDGTATTITGGVGYPKTYPRILAHLMKVSRQSFNNPQLSLSLFHHAQTLSPESYLSGCLSSAYNELIRTRWECFRDLDGVYAAIMEMDGNAVSWDKTTQREIGKIVEQVGRDVLERGAEQWGGQGVYEILDMLERKVQRSLKQSEYLDERAKRARDRRIYS